MSNPAQSTPILTCEGVGRSKASCVGRVAATEFVELEFRGGGRSGRGASLLCRNKFVKVETTEEDYLAEPLEPVYYLPGV